MKENDFSNHPKSLTEHLADKKDVDNAKIWTPRDVLIRALREIDSGEINPTDLIVSYRQKDDEGFINVSYKQSTSDAHISVGMLMAVIKLILD